MEIKSEFLRSWGRAARSCLVDNLLNAIQAGGRFISKAIILDTSPNVGSTGTWPMGCPASSATRSIIVKILCEACGKMLITVNKLLTIDALAIKSCKSTMDQVHLNLTTDTVSGTKVEVIRLTRANTRY